MKKAILLVLAVLLVPIIAIGAIMGYTFAGVDSLPDSATLSPNAKIIKDQFVGIVIIEIGDGALALVDCGPDPEAKVLKAELSARGKNLRDIKAVLLTHGHGDHTAGCSALPEAQLYALAAEADMVAGTAPNNSPMGQLFPQKPTGLRVHHPVRDGDHLELGNVGIDIYGLPGHTQGSAAYLVDGVLYMGDSATSTSAGELAGAPWIFSEDTDQNVRSLVALATRLQSRAADVKKICFAHSNPMDGFSGLATFAASH